MIAVGAPTPLVDAVASLNVRTPVGAALSSAQWSEVPVQIRQRAFWSAQLADARFAAAMHDRLLGEVSQAREQLANGNERIFSRANFVKEMQDLAQALGLGPDDPDKAGTLEDITSRRRLELIYDTQLGMAYGYARWKRDMLDDAGLEFFPAYEFKRTASRDEPRFWGEHWKAAIAALGGPEAAGATMIVDAGAEYGFRMLALKTSPIWRFLSSPKVVSGGLDTDFPPFAFRSGMGWRDVFVDDAEEAGLSVVGEASAPLEAGEDSGMSEISVAATEARDAAATARERAKGSINEGLQADAATMPDALMTAFAEQMGGRVTAGADKVLRWVEPASTVAERLLTVTSRVAAAGGDVRAAVDMALAEARALMTSAVDMDALNYIEQAINTGEVRDVDGWLRRILAQLVYLLADLTTGGEDA